MKLREYLEERKIKFIDSNNVIPVYANGSVASILKNNLDKELCMYSKTPQFGWFAFVTRGNLVICGISIMRNIFQIDRYTNNTWWVDTALKNMKKFCETYNYEIVKTPEFETIQVVNKL